MVKLSNNSIFFIVSVFITLFLFYIDEGFYNFSWMNSWGNWIVFGIYTLVLFVIQLLVSIVINRFFKIQNKTIISVVIGIPIAIFTLVTIIFK